MEGTRTRAAPPLPKFSVWWLEGFRDRNRISTHGVRIVKRITPAAERDQQDALIDFSCRVQQAVGQYGDERVVNMDETAARHVSSPCRGAGPVGGGPTRVQVAGSAKASVTVMCACTAAGAALPLSAIKMGTTIVCVNNLNIRIDGLHLYYAQRGWTTGAIMCQWLLDVLRPYLRLPLLDDDANTLEPIAALVADVYAAHCTPAVHTLCRRMRLELIIVPNSTTATAQPLDISAMGPYKQLRQREWLQRRAGNADSIDNDRSAILVAHAAWRQMSVRSLRDGWRPLFGLPREEIPAVDDV